MKHILHLIDTTGPGGAETVCIDLITHLDRNKYDAVVALNGRGWVYEELQRRGVEPVLLEPTGRSFDLGYLRRLIRLIRRHRINIVQTHLLGSSTYGSAAGLLTGTPVVSTFHGMVDIRDRRWPGRIKSALINRGSRYIVFVSRRLRDALGKASGLDAGKSVVIYNGVDTGKAGTDARGGLREELGLPRDAVIVGSVGNIRTPKGYDILLQAAAHLRERSDRYRFVIAGQGKGSLLEELLGLRTRLGLEDTVHFLGFRDDVDHVLAGIDIFALSSTTEGFSIATIEAMAHGRPVVATRSGGPEEIITDGENGLLVARGSPEELAAGIERLAQDQPLAARLMECAAADVRARFSLNAMIRQYEALYENL